MSNQQNDIIMEDKTEAGEEKKLTGQEMIDEGEEMIIKGQQRILDGEAIIEELTEKPKSIEKNKKTLYCPICKEYPDKIIEKYLDPIEETREWNTDTGNYGLIDGNFSSTEYEQLCAKCRTKLIFRE